MLQHSEIDMSWALMVASRLAASADREKFFDEFEVDVMMNPGSELNISVSMVALSLALLDRIEEATGVSPSETLRSVSDNGR